MSLTVLDRERTVAGSDFNRWLIPPAALAVHLCIGQAYATSVYKASLVEHFDASLTAIGIIFSIAIVMLGLSAAVFGTWVDTGGPRRAMVAAALFWSAATPNALTTNPSDQQQPATNIALRGPLRSTQVPPKAAERPSITIAIEKMTEIGVSLVPKWSTSGSLNTLNA